ncbi:MAG: hypothetical protein ABI193_25500 [Minicystis sp.]
MSSASPSPSRSPESPYRVPAVVADAGASHTESPSDPALFGMALVFVLASFLRAVHPLLGHERFGAEPTLAALAALIVGYHLLRDVQTRFPR